MGALRFHVEFQVPPPPPKEVCQEVAKTVCYPHVVVTEEQVPRQVCTQQCKDVVEEVSCP